MIALLQRVSEASVCVEGECVAQINGGLLVFVALERGDVWEKAVRLAERLLAFRVFSDDSGRMNLSVRDVGGDVLLVSQFTLAANTRSGLRPSFDSAMPPDEARDFFMRFVAHVQELYPERVKMGRFGADMKVALLNDGPVTFSLRV